MEYLRIAAGISLIIVLGLALYRFMRGRSGERIRYGELFDVEEAVKGQGLRFYYELPESMEVTFSILTKDGSPVKVLEDEEKEAGGHFVELSTSDLEEGDYFYCLRTPNQNTRKKFSVRHSS